MNTNGIIFNCIAAAAKVVFEHLEIAPGTYTAAQIWKALNNDPKSIITAIKLDDKIYNYNWENLGPQFSKREDNGGVYITVGSFSCGIGPEAVFEVLPKFAKIAGLPSAEISAAMKFTRDESAGMVPACSFAMPCPGSKLVKCAASDEFRPIMNAVCLDPAGYLVASDGHILTVVPATIEIQENAPELKEIPMPADVIKTAKNGEKVDIYTDGKRYVIKTATAAATVDPADLGRYPNWRGCVPSNRKHVATFTKKEFSNLQKTATKITKEIKDSFFIYESCNGAARILSYNESKQSNYNATFDAQDIAPAYAGLSAANLSRLVMTGKTIKMYYENQAQSIIFIDDNNILTLLMPCYIENAEEMGINTREMEEATKHSPAPRVDMPYYYGTATPKKKETTEDTAAAPAPAADIETAAAPVAPAADVATDAAALAPAAADVETAAAPAPDAIDTTEEDTAADAVASIVADTAAALSDEDRAALFADDPEDDTAAAPAAAVAVEMATATEDTAEDVATVPGDFVAGHDTAAEETAAEEEETTATRRASLFVRAAMWLHHYAAALIVAALPLFVLYCISETETPAAAMMHTTAAAAKIITDAAAEDTATAAAPGDTTTAPAVADFAASPADSVAAPGNTTTAAPSASHIEKETAAAPSLSPDDLAAMYAAYLAAVEDTPAPVLSDAAAEETAEDDTTAAAVYIATVHGDFVAVHTAPAAPAAADAATDSGDHAPGDLSTSATIAAAL